MIDAHLEGIEGALPRKPRRKKTRSTPRGEKEASIQSKVENYCTVQGLKFIRIPDTAYSVLFGTPGIPAHVKALLSNYLKGVPDITILKPYESHNKALLMEIKRKGGKVSQGQKNWHKGLNVVVCWGFEECKLEIDKFIQDG